MNFKSKFEKFLFLKSHPEKFPPGTKPYSREMIEKINTEYWGESWDSWYDDWKYR